jgi:hypothetical protein
MAVMEAAKSSGEPPLQRRLSTHARAAERVGNR